MPSLPEHEKEKTLAHMDKPSHSVSPDEATASPVAPTLNHPYSPLPWHVVGANEPGEARTHGIECDDGWTIADMNDDAFTENESDSGRALVNAEFIVRACNSHQELVAALEALMADIDSGVLVRDITRDAEPGWHMRMLAFVGRLHAAQAAVAKAKG
jgi:hypothetical protein